MSIEMISKTLENLPIHTTLDDALSAVEAHSPEAVAVAAINSYVALRRHHFRMVDAFNSLLEVSSEVALAASPAARDRLMAARGAATSFPCPKLNPLRFDEAGSILIA